MFDIVGLGYPYEYLVDERVTTSRLTGCALDKPSGSLFLVHIVVAVSWARSKLAFLDSQPTLAAAVQILKIPAKTIGQLIRWHMASTIKIKIQKVQNNTSRVRITNKNNNKSKSKNMNKNKNRRTTKPNLNNGNKDPLNQY